MPPVPFDGPVPVVEHSAHSNKSDIIGLGLWWCRRTDWQLRSTPCCDGKWLVRAGSDRLTAPSAD
jgi:hypothetical protein